MGARKKRAGPAPNRLSLCAPALLGAPSAIASRHGPRTSTSHCSKPARPPPPPAARCGVARGMRAGVPVLRRWPAASSASASTHIGRPRDAGGQTVCLEACGCCSISHPLAADAGDAARWCRVLVMLSQYGEPCLSSVCPLMFRVRHGCAARGPHRLAYCARRSTARLSSSKQY